MKKGTPTVLALFFIAMTLAQLLKFEDFVQIMASYHFPAQGLSLFFAILLLTLQILALPFLLRLTVAKHSMKLSAIALLLGPLLWFGLTSFSLLQHPAPVASGLFGGFIALSSKDFSLIFVTLLIALAIKSFVQLGGLNFLPWLKFTKR